VECSLEAKDWLILSERAEQKPWNTGRAPALWLSVIIVGACSYRHFVCTNSSIDRVKVRQERLGTHSLLDSWVLTFLLKEWTPLLLLFYFPWSIWELANWFDKTVIDLSD
jgi:hypothetical protein